MDYHIVISPKLGLSHEDFAEVWNTTPECRKSGQAEVYQPTETGFPMLGVDAVVMTVVLGATGSAVYDLIKVVIGRLMERKGVQENIQLKPSQQPDGSQLVVAIPEEE